MRAVSLLTGYLLKPTGPNSCTFTYLSQADPRGINRFAPIILLHWKTLICCCFITFYNLNLLGSLPKWVVNKASQVLAPKVSERVISYCCFCRLLFEDVSIFVCGSVFKVCEIIIVTMVTYWNILY